MNYTFSGEFVQELVNFVNKMPFGSVAGLAAKLDAEIAKNNASAEQKPAKVKSKK